MNDILLLFFIFYFFKCAFLNDHIGFEKKKYYSFLKRIISYESNANFVEQLTICLINVFYFIFCVPRQLVRLGKDIKSELVDGDKARLEISMVSPLRVGLYTCTAFNELGQDSTSARLILSSEILLFYRTVSNRTQN